MTNDETLKRIEEEAKTTAVRLNWDEEDTAEHNDIIKAYIAGALIAAELDRLLYNESRSVVS